MIASPVKNRLADKSGATIVIALVFFLICAAVGSTVLTSASVNAQAAATYRDTRQAENAVSSAAVLVANQFEGASVRVADSITIDCSGTEAFEKFWVQSGDSILVLEQNKEPVEMSSGGSIKVIHEGMNAIATVNMKVFADGERNIEIVLSLDNAELNEDFSKVSPYNETVYLQAIRSYDNGGNLIGLSWEKAVISKTNEKAEREDDVQ